MAAPGTAVELAEVPFHAQEAHHCGPAALLTLLEASGKEVDYQEVVDRVYVPALEGSLQVEMLAAARSFDRVAYRLPPEPAAVLAEIDAGRPVLVLLNLRTPNKPAWHYAVIVGFDVKRNRLLLRSGRNERSSQRAPAWMRRWSWAGHWAMVALRPGEWPAAADRQRLLEALAAFEDGACPGSAALAWESAAARWPTEPLVWLGVGNAAQRGDDRRRAQEAYRRVLELEPEHLPARINLALSLDQDERPCEGLEALGELPNESHPLGPRFAEVEQRLRGRCAG